jgi:flagellar protein FlaG
MNSVNFNSNDGFALPELLRKADTAPVVGPNAAVQQAKPAASESRTGPDASISPQQAIRTDTVPDENQLEATVSQLNSALQQAGRSLNFSIDKDTGITVVQIRDQKTNEVIRQIPPEEALALAKNLDKYESILFTAKA